MLTALFALAALAAPLLPEGSGAADPTTTAHRTAPAGVLAPGDAEAESAARAWLAQVDAGDWQAAYAAAGAAFRTANTPENWRAAYAAVHGKLGPAQTRRAVGFDNVAAPPAGYKRVRFATDFAARSGASETLTLEREADGWKVVGIVFE